MGSRTSKILRKNVTFINFEQSHAHSRIPISFWCIISEFQNTSHSQCIGPLEVVRA
ncbi:hypothetical protein BHE74_00051394 [Ensete ventricosum]|nr:hypothetical protein BHE74_00051394 [Ensete ventricosum]